MPRMDHHDCDRLGHNDASTGPRHRCRGWARAAAGGVFPISTCSTGPRHRCRGWRQASRSIASRRLSRFNGASASMPRMGMSARKAERPPVGLQRGLGIDAQDGWREARRAFDTTQYASTGPRHRCRGWQGGGSGNGGTLTLLQRGLGIDAEDGRRTLLECSRSAACFNGASASMPRMGHRAES